MTSRELAEKFQNPPAEFRPVSWLSWNGDVQKEEIARQLDACLDKGICQVCIVPQTGLSIPYLSDDWWDLVRNALLECRRRKMRVWLHDEYNWPSGIAAGRVLQDHPWTQSTGLAFESISVQPGQEVRIPTQGQLLRATWLGGGDVQTVTDFVWETSTPSARGHSVFRWRSSASDAGILVVFYLKVSAECAYIDTLNPDAVKVFLDYTYQACTDRLAEFMPETLCGFYTHEPHIGSSPLPWTMVLPDLFRKRFGYDLLPRLHELILDVEETGADRSANHPVINCSPRFMRTRRDYWSLISQRFAESYHGQLGGWCSRHGMQYAGSLAMHQDLANTTMLNGDVFEVGRNLDVPGLNASSPISDRMHASIARWGGHRNAIGLVSCQSTWSLSPSGIKSQAQQLIASGATVIHDGPIPYSLCDMRKTLSYGRAFSTPWQASYGEFAELCARLCLVQSQGNRNGEVVILWPTTASWCILNAEILSSRESSHGDPHSGPQEGFAESAALASWKAMEDSVDSVAACLTRRHWSFDFLFESALSECRTRSRTLLHQKGGEVRCVILPSTPVISRKAFQKLKAFSDRKGFLIAIDPLPRLSPDADWNVEAEVRELFRRPNTIVLPRIEDDEGFEEVLDSTLFNAIGKPFTVEGKDVSHLAFTHHSIDDAEIVGVANLSDHPIRATIHAATQVPIEIWSVDDGTRRHAITTRDDDKQWFEYEFEGYESIGIIACRESTISGDRLWSKTRMSDAGPLYRIDLPREWAFRTDRPNLLKLNIWMRADTEDKGIADQWYLRAIDSTEGWHACLPKTAERSEIYWMRGVFSVEDDFTDLWLIVDSELKEQIYVNGWLADKVESRPIWDSANRGVRLDGLVRRGMNTIVIRACMSELLSRHMCGDNIDLAEIDPVVVSGRFTVVDRGGIQAIGPERKYIHSGESWHRQGLPHFVGTGIYETSFEIPEEIASRCDIRLGRSITGGGQPIYASLDLGDVADAAEIILNDSSIATRCWRPFRADITRAIRAGTNKIALKVHNNYANLFNHCSQSEVKNYGLLSPISIRFMEVV